MSRGFFGKSDQSAKPPTKAAGSPRGLEVIEDDPETAWSLWEQAMVDHDARFTGLQPTDSAFHQPEASLGATWPALQSEVPATARDNRNNSIESPAPQDATARQRMHQALQIVHHHHPRIASSIADLWGQVECSAFINRLIMSSDDHGHARDGFHQDVAAAMLELVLLHDTEFGLLDDGAGASFADAYRSAGRGGVR